MVGIDLGTTHSSVALLRDAEVHVIQNTHDEVLTPSAVALDPHSGKMLVGRAAKDLLSLHPERGASSFKRWIGTSRTQRIGDREFNATELSAFVLDALRADAERALGKRVE
ncbi:MAG TPA: Hsp70 family protein, partial [Polyangiaceae bacterium]|nr:Hsp70 family protein [Polyangiaceae bacterium]